ncbi:mitochondrial ribosomal protein L33 [Arctopsyche grandis]|uniref:mitochondrial ribosomal protein L33 n=1 Tax=Arctopsyche grandis TaxID=121162 RepID=UPI00406D85EE
MFLTQTLLKKAKSKYIMVLMESVISKHTFNATRERLGDKLEFEKFDPLIGLKVIYREAKKIRSVR